MAQTTGQISSKDYVIETSVDGAVWVDQSGVAIKIDPGARSVMTGKAHTFAGKKPLLTAGKLEGMTVKTEFVYTEDAAELFDDAWNAQVNETDFYIRWAPKGGQSGESRFTTDKGIVKNLTPPAGDAGSGNPVICSFDLETADVTRTTIP